MIKITVELVPYGFGTPKKIAEAYIVNDGIQSRETDGRKGAYEFNFYGKRRHRFASGKIYSFPRKSANVWKLIARCLKEAGIQ